MTGEMQAQPRPLDGQQLLLPHCAWLALLKPLSFGSNPQVQLLLYLLLLKLVSGASYHLCSCVTEYATTQAIQWSAPHRAFPRARVGAYEVRRA